MISVEGLEQGYNEGTLATSQRPLRTAPAKAVRQSFITVDFHDMHTSHIELSTAEAGQVETIKRADPVLLQDFWTFLATFKLPRGKHWIIAHRTKWMMDVTNWLAHFDQGELQFPTRKNKDKEAKRSGRLVLTPSATEVDLLAGKNTVKLLDWWNYGISPNDYGKPNQADAESQSLTILRQWIRWTHANRLPASKTTAAQVGWTKAKTTFGRRAVSVNYDDDARTFERQAYFGGRCEPFRLGIIPGVTYSIDVNGCYADICKTCPIPYHLRREFRKGLDVDKIDAQDDKHWIAEVIIETDTPDYPLRDHHQPLYPIGQFRTTLCWPELQHALQRKRVTKILRAAEYLAAPFFDGYANWFQREKATIGQGDYKRLKPALKAIFNRSLGFTARLNRDWIPWKVGFGHRFWSGLTNSPEDGITAVRAQIIDGQAEWLRVGGEPKEGLPFVHASICSWARLRLLAIIEHAGRENVLYVDTDGLLVTFAGMKRLEAVEGLLGDLPGQLMPRWTPATAIIRGAKSYRLGTRVVCSGLESWRHNQWDTSGVGKIELVYDVERQAYIEELVRVQLTTLTGRSDSKGNVTPWTFRCVSRGELSDFYTNEIA